MDNLRIQNSGDERPNFRGASNEKDSIVQIWNNNLTSWDVTFLRAQDALLCTNIYFPIGDPILGPCVISNVSAIHT